MRSALAPRAPPINPQARRVDHMMAHTTLLQRTVKPKPVIAGLVTPDHLDHLSAARLIWARGRPTNSSSPYRLLLLAVPADLYSG
jgi:hypothetical protein